MNGNEWIAELKVGDCVYTTQRFSQQPAKGAVTRLTKCQVMVDFGARRTDRTVIEIAYWINSGCTVGADTWNKQHLVQATAEINQRYLERERNGTARAMLGRLAGMNFTLDQCERIIAWCADMNSEAIKKEG